MEVSYPWLRRSVDKNSRDAPLNDLQLVEILFARGLVKVLFATETFAMVGILQSYPPPRFPY